MEARSVDTIPRGPEWQYEPKWGGFRCLLSRQGNEVDLRSKSGEGRMREAPRLREEEEVVRTLRFDLSSPRAT